MLQVSTSTRTSPPITFLSRICDLIDGMGCETVWARSSGPHVLLGLRGHECFARITPLGGASYGLAFRALGASPSHTNAWEPLLLVDDLASVIEHALVAVDALPDACAE
jgi:hypothetical protein